VNRKKEMKMENGMWRDADEPTAAGLSGEGFEEEGLEEESSYDEREDDGHGMSDPDMESDDEMGDEDMSDEEMGEEETGGEGQAMAGGGRGAGTDLESRGVRELRWRARQINLPGRSKMNKQQLIEALRRQMSQQSGEP
jgi:hypothetical protein